MATVVTKRIAPIASGGATRRVNLSGHHTTYDCWARSWGVSWGNAWYNSFSASELSGNITQRVTESLLRHRHLLLENGTDALLREDGGFLLLEGEAAVTTGASHTKRVTL